jgi:hypothetical protein
VLVGLIAGAAAGALLLEHARDIAPVLPPAVTLVVVASGLRARRTRAIAGPELTPVKG